MTFSRSRAAALATTLLLHLAAAGFLLIRSGVVPAPAAPRSIALFDVAASQPTPAPPRRHQPIPVPPTPPQPIVIPPPVVPMPSALVVSLLEQADLSAAGGACDLTAPVQAALQESPEVQAALLRVAPDRRSVANAVMLWDGDWATAIDGQLDPSALEVIRAVVTRTVAAAGEACRSQPQTGPRLLYIPGTTTTTVLALGSGAWRWQDLGQNLADPAQPASPPQ